ncbi:MAG: ATP-dependent helicase [Aquiluna sp.]|nr:ATP-dependent helicase [Aquiluna sp.]MCF8546095.1 ATP-dependent helicase [Aquiluna sp.]
MAKFSAQQVYSVISEYTLTPEQVAAVEGSSLSAPTLIVAGAGSGKTELMTVRILYLVANGFAAPAEILGLTFTKKAASELSNRVSQALFRMRETEFWPAELSNDFEKPKIATYNSFGNEMFRELALGLGYEEDATVLTEATSLTLVNEVLKNLPAEISLALQAWDRSSDYLVELLLSLSSEMTDNQVSAQQADQVLAQLQEKISVLPKTESGDLARFQYTQDFLDAIGLNRLLLMAAQEYLSQKRMRNLVDFSDQVALALEAVTKTEISSPFKFVMLDEYQDTSTIQTRLLAKLFYARAVMAVGDPNQAIYGWRGASSANLDNFFEDFGSSDSLPLSLSTSWRSGPGVVGVANLISQELEAPASYLDSTKSIKPIRLNSVRPQNGSGNSFEVQTAIFQDEVTESEAVCNWIASRIDSDSTAAILFRTKSAMSLYAKSLDELGIEYEITGLSGLLDLPEVVDLVSALRVIESADSGAYLMRLLTGPRWRIGPKDLVALSRYAKKLSRIRSEVNSTVPVTITEALDELRRPESEKYLNASVLGTERLQDAANLFYRMRTKGSLGLGELCWSIIRDLEIDIELFAHSNSRNPMANLQAFISRIIDFENSSIRPSLTSLIRYLEKAMEKESFELPKTGAKKGVVQILTAHAAKGLEWDSVAVVGLSSGGFPLDMRETKGWLSAGKIPFSLRGDFASLPVWSYDNCTTQKELNDSFKIFQSELKERHLREERRLAYVAITRSKGELLMTASHFKRGAKKPRPISPFLQEVIDFGLATELTQTPEPLEVNPLMALSETLSWPIDPLGARRGQVSLAASAVEKSVPAAVFESAELALLLEERERASWVAAPDFPSRLSASSVSALLADPARFAANLLRPMPSLFSEVAASGTAFHQAIEDGFLGSGDFDFGAMGEPGIKLGENFSGSRFANLSPVFIEEQIEFSLDSILVVCKLDAVFEDGGDFEILDWKSGKVPKDEKELQSRAVQLALYRIALSRKLNIGLERIKASFFFASDGIEVAPKRLLTESEIIERLAEIRRARRD